MHELCDNLCFSFPVFSLLTLMHVHLATSAQHMSGLHVFVSTRFLVFVYVYFGLT